MLARRFASWTAWSSWSSCSVTCTEGVHQRRRSCYGLGKCDDPYLVGKMQTKPCEDISCCPGMKIKLKDTVLTLLYGPKFVDT